MTVSRFTRFAVFSVLMALFCVTASAAPWMSLGPKRKLETLVITGNYKSPRLLAELIQSESRQPYMLLPDPARGESRIYFMPPKSAALEIKEADFNDFIRNANPRRIIILGDERYVSRRYEDMLDKVIPVVRITGSNWVRISEELTFMLNLNRLDRNYKRLREQMLEDPYRPVSRPAPKQDKQDKPAEAAPAADAPAAPAPEAADPAKAPAAK